MTELKLIGLLVAHLLLTALPGAAGASLVARRDGARAPVVLGCGLASGGVVAMAGFWLYLWTPVAGKVFSFAVVALALAVLAFVVHERAVPRALVGQLATPVILWAFGSAFLVFLGFAHGGTANPLPMAAGRFTAGNLPSDSDIPRFFAAWIYAHGGARPPIYPPDWLMSDRPPLQIGYALLQMPFGWDLGLNYQIVGVLLQQLWIVGLWALLLAANVTRVTRALCVVMVLVSDVAIVNGFFVWPKLLPAAMLLAACALVLTPAWSDVRRRPQLAVLVAALVGLALLGHGSSVFGVIPLVLVALVRGLPGWRWTALLVVAVAVLYVPWSEYQKHGDPPGNRLTKWMIAGHDQIDHNTALSDIRSGYATAGVDGAIHHKAENFATMAGGGPMATQLADAARSLVHGHLARADGDVRTISFFYLLPSFGFLLIAPLLLLLARWRGRLRASPELSLAMTSALVVLVGAIAWGLLLFGNTVSTTVIHQGSLALPILGFCALICVARAAYPRIAIALVAVTAAFSLAVYVPSLHPLDHTGYYPGPIALAALSLIVFAVVAFAGVSLDRGFALSHVRRAAGRDAAGAVRS